MFGCTSNRALNRRKEAGMIADKEADKVIVTKLDGKDEDVIKVFEYVKSYISGDKEIICIPDRKLAIKSAIKEARDGWLIVLAGNENDSTVVQELLQ